MTKAEKLREIKGLLQDLIDCRDTDTVQQDALEWVQKAFAVLIQGQEDLLIVCALMALVSTPEEKREVLEICGLYSQRKRVD
jgi:hypothetical protein